MPIAHQIKEFIEKQDIKNELKDSFSSLLSVKNCEDLDIEDKNLQIDENNIEYKKNLFGFHLFRTPILKQNNEIGYYALEYDDEFKIIDDFFQFMVKLEC